MVVDGVAVGVDAIDDYGSGGESADENVSLLCWAAGSIKAELGA